MVVNRYKIQKEINKNISVVKLWDLVEIKTWKKDVNEWNPNWEYPFFTCAKEISFAENYSFDTEALLIAWNWDIWDIKYYNWKFEAYQRTYILDNFDWILPKYLFFYLKYKLKETIAFEKQGSTMPYIKLWTLQNFELPLPSLDYQQEIIKQIEEYNKIISWAKQVIDTYKPEIDIKKEWEFFELWDISNPEYWVWLEAKRSLRL